MRRRPTATMSKSMPDTHTPATSSEKIHTEAHKRQRAHKAKIETHQEAKTSPPRDEPRPAPDRTGTGVRNQNPDKEPESEPTPTPTFEQLPEHRHPHTQVDSAPPPPTDPPSRQQSALLEGESTCNKMVPTRKFRRPLRPPMHRRPPGQCRVPEHAPAQNPSN
ncbi:hypothetical protein AMECASPLE_031892 [Ameca splendens]|uniref:Uncharacterized protein n=1 Tax=Ameca splendens TaxID=208324 RepID=A0ABV1ADP7_9TELE